MKDSTALVTGAAGVIGSMTVKTLARASESEAPGMRVVAMVRDIEKARRIFEGYDVVFCEGNVLDSADFSEKPDYIIHCASMTKSEEMIARPVETLLTSVAGTANILKAALKSEVRSMVYVSSMEMYGTNARRKTGNDDTGLVTEDMLGFIDLNERRSAYPEGKRAAECLCQAYYHEYGVSAKTARLAQVFGAGVQRDESRVFAQFARSAMGGKNIVLHTDGSSEGNYCYLADAVLGMLTILLKGRDGEAYNVVNEKLHRTVRQMAEFVAKEVADGKSSVVMDIPDDVSKLGYAAKTKLRLSSEKLRKLGWSPAFDMGDMYRRMIAFWEEQDI